jgi:hypothetical protein
MGWKEMTQPVSLEEYAGEIPRPVPRPAQPADSWVQLRQQSGANIGEPGVGYYTYGTMPKGQAGGTADAQWGEGRAMDVIQSVADKLVMGSQFTPFGVGNISLVGGKKFPPHGTHRDGLGIDVRPARVDQAPSPTNYRSPDYDRAATRRLIEGFRDTGQAKAILFNDPELYDDPELKGFVKPWKGHDNHFHVQLK